MSINGNGLSNNLEETIQEMLDELEDATIDYSEKVNICYKLYAIYNRKQEYTKAEKYYQLAKKYENKQ
jgi:hypothetical protein